MGCDVRNGRRSVAHVISEPGQAAPPRRRYMRTEGPLVDGYRCATTGDRLAARSHCIPFGLERGYPAPLPAVRPTGVYVHCARILLGVDLLGKSLRYRVCAECLQLPYLFVHAIRATT